MKGKIIACGLFVGFSACTLFADSVAGITPDAVIVTNEIKHKESGRYFVYKATTIPKSKTVSGDLTVNCYLGWTRESSDVFSDLYAWYGTVIGDFSECRSLTSATFVNDGHIATDFYCGDKFEFESMVRGAFENCTSLTNVVLPTSVKKIPDDAFKKCADLRTVRAEGCVEIGTSSYEGSGVCAVDLSNVKSVGARAFADCTNLTTVVFGKDLSALGKDAFKGAAKLTNVTFQGKPPTGLEESGLLDNYPANVSYGTDDADAWQSVLKERAKEIRVSFKPESGCAIAAGEEVEIEMTCSCAGAKIYYTTDGSVPTQGSILYDGSVRLSREVGKELIVSAIAIVDGWSVESPQVKSIVFPIEKCSAPNINSETTRFDAASLQVSIECATDSATVFYTTDGSEPSRGNGAVYTGPFAVYATTVIKAFAVKEDYKDSVIVEAVFDKENKLSEASGLLNYLPRDWHDVDGSSEPWTVVTDDTHDGESALKSACEYSKMDVSVPGTGRVAFWWKIVGDQGSSLFFVDGQQKAKMEGSDGWQQVVIDVREPGTHTLIWEYWCDPYVGDFSGSGYLLIDDVSWSAVVDDDKTSRVFVYDGKEHSIEVAAENDAQAKVLYALSESGPFSEEIPGFVDVMEPLTVWYKVDGGMVDGVPVYLGSSAVGKATVTIQPKAITPEMIKVLDKPVYDGTAQEPGFEVSDGEPSIIKGFDWELVGYANNVDAGLATVTIRAVEGANYTGEATSSFEIAKAEYDVSIIEWSKTRSFVYDGKTHGVTLEGLPTGVSATLTGCEAKDAGSYVAHATLTFDAKNYQTPSVADCNWTIERRNVVLKIADLDKSYDGYSLSASGKDVSGDGYVDGECLDYYDFTKLVDMGSGVSSCSFRDSETAKVSNYNVTLVEGTLRVTVGDSVYAGEVVSAEMRADEPNIMDIRYVVHSVKDKVDVRLAIFKDGVRSFANVVLPQTYVEGTESNVGDGVAANSTNTVSWRVSDDWDIDLAKVKVDVLVKPNETYLPFRWVTIPGRNAHPTMKVSTNPVDAAHLFNALLWLYADRDSGLSLVEGGLLHDGFTLAVRDDVTDAGVRYVYEKMGYSVLEGEDLDYVRSALRKPMKNEPAFSRYAVKVLGE